MKKICLYALLILVAFGCETSNKKSDLLDYLNNDAAIIIKTKNVTSLTNNLNNNTFLKEIDASQGVTNLSKRLSLIPYFNTEDELFICLVKNELDSLDFSVITKFKKGLFEIDSLPNHSAETLQFESKTITKSTFDSHELYSTIVDSIFIGATNMELLNKTIEGTTLDTDLKALIKSSGPDSQLSFLVNKKFDMSLKSFFIDDTIETHQLTDYLFVDVDVTQSELNFNGVARSADSTLKLIDVFKNTIPQENKLATIAPADCDGFISITFDDFNQFHKNLIKFNQKDSLINHALLFDNVIEIGSVFQGTEKAVILNSLDIYITKDALLNDQDIIETFRDIEIFGFTNPTLFYDTFHPFLNIPTADKYCILDNFIVFSDSLEFLKSIITNYKNQTTYQSRNHYLLLKEKFSDESSILSVVGPNALETIINRNTKDSLNLQLDDYQSTGIQFIYDSHFAHVNAIIQKAKSPVYENSISESSNISLEADLLNNPQLVTNHLTQEKEIVVQDINNNLYLISNNGKVLWKKQLQGALLGKVEQIDMYKNGRLQLVFATPHRVYVLDRNGKDVAPFPLKFNDAITQPLSVFDYDNNKKYRILITQGKDIIMLDAKGKTVKGFTFKNADASIIHQPQHIRIGRKDYILIKTTNKLYILDRTGKTRVSPKNNYNYSSESVYLYNNNFATTTQDGQLVTIDTKGNTAVQNLNLRDRHHLVTTTKSLVTLSENILTIKGKTYELDFGDYSQPDIFYLYDKIYVAVTDKQTQKVFLFDSNAKLLSNFPVYGTSKIDMNNIDKDRNLEFIVKGEANTILIYQIN